MTYPNNANVYLPGTIQIPSALEIDNITRSNPMIVTVSADPITQVDTYIPGQLVKLTIPFGYGMQQANGITAQIILVIDSDLYLNVNSTNFDPFIPDGDSTPASIAPSGSRNLSFNNGTNQVPFQSYNERGN